ncbi:hypothetical protein JB92DRAFT_2832952 [Gautieria morchelliformis]|nr:hypothetical protein JB92DRAFT_2832952 [Gautieria morchelliformis]
MQFRCTVRGYGGSPAPYVHTADGGCEPYVERAYGSSAPYVSRAHEGFLGTTPEEIQEAVNVNVVGVFAFARETILGFKDLLIYFSFRGTLLFTGVTDREEDDFLLAVGRFGIRARSQSLSKVFRKQDIHSF